MNAMLLHRRMQEETPLDTRLVEFPDRQIPGMPTVQVLSLADGTQLRTARWVPDASANGETAGTVLICTGRGEFIEKYFEVVDDLLARRLAVVVFDWRGQGFSTRALRDRRKGHVSDFDEYDRDLSAVYEQILLTFCPKPFFGLAHSMGGAIAIHHAFHNPGAFERMVLSAPMIAIHNLPFPEHLRRLLRVLNRSGLKGSYLPRGERTAVLEHGFQDNVLTSDPVRFGMMTTLTRSEPLLSVGAPTIGWLNAAFRAMARFDDVAFCEHVTTPMLMIVPGSDRVVSVPAMLRAAQRLRVCRAVTIPFARHEILMERDTLRQQFWAAFDAFIPVAPSRMAVTRAIPFAHAVH